MVEAVGQQSARMEEYGLMFHHVKVLNTYDILYVKCKNQIYITEYSMNLKKTRIPCEPGKEHEANIGDYHSISTNIEHIDTKLT